LMGFLVFIGIVLLVIGVKTIRIVPQASVMLIERLGRFNRVAASGLNILTPFLDKPRAVYWTNTRPGLTSIDLREQYLDLPPQPVITRDNRSEEHTSELQSRSDLVCRLLLEKKKKKNKITYTYKQAR